MNRKSKQSEKKPRPPALGLAVVADLWLWGSLLLFAPNYFGIVSGWQIPFYVLGGLALVISFGGALIELGRLWKTEALSYWGAAIILLVPAGALCVSIERQFITGALGIIARIGVLILTAIGGSLFFHGVPYLFWQQNGKAGESLPDSVKVPDNSGEKQAKRKANMETIANVIVALLSLATAIVTLAEKLSP